jgi:hypothetical protein
MATRRKTRTLHFKDGGRVPDAVIPEAPLGAAEAPPVIEPEPAAVSSAAEELRPSPQPEQAPTDNALKQALDSLRHAEEIARQPKPQPAQDFESRIAAFPDTAKDWLRKHPEFIHDQNMTRQVAIAHDYVVGRKGIKEFTPEYFRLLDEEFGFHVPAQHVQPEPAPLPQSLPEPRRSFPVSAPPSRESPTLSGGRVREPTHLTAQEAEIARISFPHMSLDDAYRQYARNREIMNRKKATGEIQS